MTLRLAPHSLFRASALASFARHSSEGLDGTARGLHLRVRVHPWIGFPLHPFAAWRLPLPGAGVSCPVVWRDERGRKLPHRGGRIRLDDRSVVACGSIRGGAPDDPWLWVEVDADDGVLVDVLDPRSIPGVDEPRVLATRRSAPHRFGHGPIVRLRARGPGSIGASRGLRLSQIDVPDPSLWGRPTTFGLPFRKLDRGSRTVAWYAPGADAIGAAAERLTIGAPHRMSPVDELVAPSPDAWDRAREVERILGAIGPAFVDPFLEAGFRDPSRAPIDSQWSDGDERRLPQPVHARAPVVGSLLTMAADPSIARYLGLATTIPIGDDEDARAPSLWVVAGRFAVQEGRIVLPPIGAGASGRSLGDLLHGTVAPSAVGDLLDPEFPDAVALGKAVEERKTNVEGAWSVATLLTVAVATGDAPPDRPAPVALSLAEPGAWIASDPRSAASDERWRQTLSLGRTAVRGTLGFARVGPGATVPLHRIEPDPAGRFVRRALPLLPDRSGRTEIRLTDPQVPSESPRATWRVWQSDEFGRWSDEAELRAPVPPRPPPPPPVAEPAFVAVPDDGTEGARSPGMILLRYEVPRAADGEPGSRSIARLVVKVDGIERASQSVGEGTTAEVRIPADPCEAGTRRTVVVNSRYVDVDRRESDERAAVATVRCSTYDTRAPRPLSTSPVLLWSGRPDATGGSELSLRWPRRPGASRYGVYLGDGRRLARALGISVADARVRAAWAWPIHGERGRLRDRRAFAYLGDVSDPGGGAGEVVWKTRIEGGLRSVQFLRIVPVSEGGAEPPFEACGLVPIAIPTTERPPAPILDAETSSDGRVTLRVRALGMRAEVLAASPGSAPEFRVRRTTDADGDPAYARPFRSGLLRAATLGEWIGELDVAATEARPFVRALWTAEVRYPAEASVPPGFAPVAGDVGPVWPELGAASESLWSEPSPPTSSLYVPSSAPATPAAPVLLGDFGRLSLVAFGLPVAHPRAIASYRLEIHRRVGAGAPRLVEERPIGSPQESWGVPDDGLESRFHLVVVDPLGRRSAPSA